MLLSKKDIRHAFRADYYHRGERYQRQGRVLRTDWFADENILEADVLGSELYSQTIELEVYRSRITISGECSCPVGFNCKHVVAALLAFFNTPQQAVSHRAPAAAAPAPDPLQAWQESVLQAVQAERNLASEPNTLDRLLYILQCQQGPQRTDLKLEVIRARVLKNGGYGKPMSFSLNAYTDYYGSYGYGMPSYASEADTAILKRLRLEPSHHKPRLQGEDGALLLKRLLQTGRCFLQDKDRPPLRLGARRPLRIDWEQEDENLTRLRLQPEGLGANWILCPLEPPWYIDPDSNLCGLLELNGYALSGALLDRLRYLPAVPTRDLPQLARFLLKQLPPHSVPLPVELPVHDLVDVEPMPVLRLWGRPRGDTMLELFGRVQFDYQGVRTAPMMVLEQAFSLHQQDEQEYRIQHHALIEADALAQLVALDFEPTATEPEERQLDVYFPADNILSQSIRWQQFVNADLPALEQQGWLIERDASFQLDILEPSQWQSSLDDSSGEHWFDLALSVTVADQQVQLLPLLVNLLEQFGPNADPLAQLDQMEVVMVALSPGVWLRLPSAQLRPVLEVLIELYDGLRLGAAGQIRLPRAQATTLLELERALAQQGAELLWQGGEKIRELARKLADFEGIQGVPVPANLQAELRSYQQAGLNWLQFLREYRFGGILADDMGLGKTVQTLAHLLLEKNAGRLTQPALVIAPTSVISNWRRETERFAPELRVLMLHGSGRKKDFDRIGEHDLVLTTYPLLLRDHKQLQQQRFHSLILDEAHYIKNAKAKTTQVVSTLQAGHFLCLTGTPLENNLSELWSLFNFLMPGFLSDLTRFTRLFRTPIEKTNDPVRQRELNRRIKPFVLRRTKQQVARELPPKTEIVQNVTLGKEQAVLYESIRVAMEQRVRQLLADRGLARSRIEILDALLKLRQVCCDPRLVKLASAAKVTQSAKLELLLDILPELLAEGHKVLLFSQFVDMLQLIETELQNLGIDYTKLTGRTRKRDEAIARFQEGSATVFLISLKAGGVGLNLTAADTVIVYDPWWNPAAEQQAIDRAYRIGQDKPVFVYKLIAEQSLEEKILLLQQRKKALADALYEEGAGGQLALTADELLQLLQPLGHLE